jgi:hypothetical protein
MKLRGHYGYFGFTHNYRALHQYYERVRRIWLGWLRRRNNRHPLIWTNYEAILTRQPLVSPRIFRNLYAPCECSN